MCAQVLNYASSSDQLALDTGHDAAVLLSTLVSPFAWQQRNGGAGGHTLFGEDNDTRFEEMTVGGGE
jgi:hypothetical protein